MATHRQPDTCLQTPRWGPSPSRGVPPPPLPGPNSLSGRRSRFPSGRHEGEYFTTITKGNEQALPAGSSPCPAPTAPTAPPGLFLPSGRDPQPAELPPPGRRGLGGEGCHGVVLREINLITEPHAVAQHLPLPGAGCLGRCFPSATRSYLTNATPSVFTRP